MPSFFELLEGRVQSSNSLLCIGLDPHVKQLAEPTAADAKRFCLNIIEKSAPYAAAFKPNAAFFEALGPAGVQALVEVIAAIPDDIPVILDVKRGDIETTAQAYATSAYDVFKAGAVTLSPYMGWDSISPFLGPNKAVFVLCKTSNHSSKDFQDQEIGDGTLLYECVAAQCSIWNSKQSTPSIGLVVGATDVPALRRVRFKSPEAWILCPGVGAQGGDAREVSLAGLRADGSGLLVSVSRAVSGAADIASAALGLRDEINVAKALAIEERRQASSESGENLLPFQRDFISFATENRVLQFGTFTLKSGRISPYFFNAGLFFSGQSMHNLGRYYAQAIRESNIEFDVIFGPAYKGIPLATSVGVAWYELYGESKDVTFNRKEAKDHGEGGLLVGAPIKGRRVLIVDDVITAGTAIRESLETLRSAEALLSGVVVSLDRQEMVSDSVRESAIQQVEKVAGAPVCAIVRLKHLVAYLETQPGTASEQLEAIRQYRTTYGVEY